MKSSLVGQYRFPRGIYYGGNKLQEEARTLEDLIMERIGGYSQVLHIDLHTGYGPHDQMTIVNSPLERVPAAELAERFAYPRVVASDAQAFFAIRGDILDYFYTRIGREFPQLRYFATAFEFGTMGDTLPGAIRSLRATVFENQARQAGVTGPRIEEQVRAEYRELFYPPEDAWREKALEDARASSMIE